jgi:lysophospholipase L1-like esterase
MTKTWLFRGVPRLGLIHLCVAFIACLPMLAVATDTQRWVSAWSTSLQAIPRQTDLPPRYRTPEVGDRTFRQIVYPTLAGNDIRLHVSNRYGSVPLDIQQLRIATSSNGTAATRDSGTPITFAGKSSLHLPPGAERDSDPVRITLHNAQPYAISIYLGPSQSMQAWHRVASQTSYLSTPGNHTADMSGASFRSHLTQFAWVTAITVASSSAKAVMAIGDSITDGMASSPGLNRRWPDDLARRLARESQTPIAVLNAGISGNRLLSDSPCYGERLLSRFEREVTDSPGVQTSIVLIGINDINFAAMPPHRGLDCDTPHTPVSAESLIAGYRQLADIAHRQHIRLLIGTLTPAGLPPQRESIRTAVNRWIRNSNVFDGVVDFDAALRDPAQPQRLRAAYDSGDHIHPSDAGYAAMAQAIPLGMLQGAVRR